MLKTPQKLMIVTFFLPFSLSHVQILLDKSESERVFGVGHAVYYVREGVVNKFAMNTNQGLIPSDVDHVDFHWRSDLSDVPYRIGISFSETQAMEFPAVNMSNIGFVPTKFQSFRLQLKCLGTITSVENFSVEVN